MLSKCFETTETYWRVVLHEAEEQPAVFAQIVDRQLLCFESRNEILIVGNDLSSLESH